MLKIEESKSRSRRWSPLLVLLAISIGLVAAAQSGVLGLAEQAVEEKSAKISADAGGKLRTELANILQDLLNEYKSQSTGIDGYIKSLEKSLEEAKTDAERRALRWEIGQMEMMRAAFDTRKKDLEEEIKSLREEKRDGSVAEMIRRELEITKLFADYLRAVGDQPEKVARFEQLIKELEKLKLVCDFLKNSLPPGKPKPEEKEEPKPPVSKPPAPPKPPEEPVKPPVKPDKPAKPGQEELDKLLEEMEKDAREREEGSIDKQIEEWNKQLEELEKQLKEMGVMTETPTPEKPAALPPARTDYPNLIGGTLPPRSGAGEARTIYEDILNHNRVGRQIYDRQVTTMHEGAHEATAAADRLLFHTQLQEGVSNVNDYDAFYVGGNKYLVLEEPKIDKRDVLGNIPGGLRIPPEYASYLSNSGVGPLGPYNSNYILNEWTADILAMEGGVQLIDRGKWTSPRENKASVMEYTFLALALAGKVKYEKPDYWRNHPEYREFIALNLTRAKEIYDKMSRKEYSKYFFDSRDINAVLIYLGTSNDNQAAKIREMIKEVLGNTKARELFGI